MARLPYVLLAFRLNVPIRFFCVVDVLASGVRIITKSARSCLLRPCGICHAPFGILRSRIAPRNVRVHQRMVSCKPSYATLVSIPRDDPIAAICCSTSRGPLTTRVPQCVKIA